MSMTFTKLFSSITESTVWYEPDSTRLVWITMLAMADRQGRVWGSVPGLAGRARVSLQATREALKCFLSPDADSRTKEFEGRRIEEIDGGWRLLNHAKYRELRDEESRKAYQREWVKKRRQKESTVDRSRPASTNAEAEADTESERSEALSSLNSQRKSSSLTQKDSDDLQSRGETEKNAARFRSTARTLAQKKKV
jgi:hypothetical protein